MEPGAEGYKHMIYEKGQAAAAGDRVVIEGQNQLRPGARVATRTAKP